MKNKKTLLVIISAIILLSIGLNVIVKVTEDSRQERYRQEAAIQQKTYTKDSMRFNVTLTPGQYQYVSNGFFYGTHEQSNDKKFKEQCKTLTIEKEYETKFSKYIVTKESFYMQILQEDKPIYVKVPTTIDRSFYNNLLSMIRNGEAMEVEPFNDGIYAFVKGGKSICSILNLSTGEVIWELGNYYESPQLDIYNDTVNCTGDLDFSGKTYMFNKYGQLIGEKKIKDIGIKDIVFLYDFIATIAVIIFLFFLIRLSSNKAVKIIFNIINTIVLIIVIIVSGIAAMFIF